MAMSYARRRVLASRFSKNLWTLARWHHASLERVIETVAERLDVDESTVRSLLNPARRVPPALRVRRGLQVVSARWPDPMRARDWT